MDFELQQIEREAKRAHFHKQKEISRTADRAISIAKRKAALDAYEERKLNRGRLC